MTIRNRRQSTRRCLPVLLVVFAMFVEASVEIRGTKRSLEGTAWSESLRPDSTATTDLQRVPTSGDRSSDALQQASLLSRKPRLRTLQYNGQLYGSSSTYDDSGEEHESNKTKWWKSSLTWRIARILGLLIGVIIVAALLGAFFRWDPTKDHEQEVSDKDTKSSKQSTDKQPEPQTMYQFFPSAQEVMCNGPDLDSLEADSMLDPSTAEIEGTIAESYRISYLEDKAGTEDESYRFSAVGPDDTLTYTAEDDETVETTGLPSYIRIATSATETLTTVAGDVSRRLSEDGMRSLSALHAALPPFIRVFESTISLDSNDDAQDMELQGVELERVSTPPLRPSSYAI